MCSASLQRWSPLLSLRPGSRGRKLPWLRGNEQQPPMLLAQPALREVCWALPARNKTETHPETGCRHAPFFFRLSPAWPPRKKLVHLLREIRWVYLVLLCLSLLWLSLQTGAARQDECRFIGFFPWLWFPSKRKGHCATRQGFPCHPVPVPGSCSGWWRKGPGEPCLPMLGFACWKK